MLWSFQVTPVTRAFGVGLFVSWIPTPGQMAISAVIAMQLRANLPISVGLVWLSNPLTWIPLYYSAYLVGTWILGIQSISVWELFTPDYAFSHIFDMGASIFVPMMLGTLLMAIFSAIVGAVTVGLIYRLFRMIRLARLLRKRATSR